MREDAVRMQVSGLTVDPFTNSPVLMLKDAEGGSALPIWIGLVEASAIATELEHIELARPLTHDLLKNLIERMGGALARIEVCDLRDSTFYANLYVEVDGATHVVDCRPSDAIALALRCDAPIFVARAVIEKSVLMREEQAEADPEAMRQWVEMLEKLSPEDFGKYKM